MVSGFDRYFQIAPCFRDEDPRADRSPTDFYQLDMEMSFVTQDDVFDTISPVVAGCFERFGGGRRVDPVEQWPRIPFAEALRKYGTDKPDLRIGIEMEEVSEHFRGGGFGIFAKILERAGTEIRAIPAPGGGSRKFCDRMNAWAQKEGLPGMGYIFWREVDQGVTDAAGPLAKNLGPERTEAIRAQLGLGAGDAAFFLGGQASEFEAVAGRARVEIGRELGLVDEDRFAFAWIVDFPMYERDEEGKVDFSHNPFSMPQGGMEALEGDPEPQARRDVPGLRRRRLRGGRGAAALRRHGQRVPLRSAAARGLRGGDRQDGDASSRRGDHPRGDAVPDEPARRGPDDGRPVRAAAGAARGARAPAPAARLRRPASGPIGTPGGVCRARVVEAGASGRRRDPPGAWGKSPAVGVRWAITFSLNMKANAPDVRVLEVPRDPEARPPGDPPGPSREGRCAPPRAVRAYSTVTDFARLRGWSTSVPLWTAVW
jgi:hypothetical protein